MPGTVRNSPLMVTQEGQGKAKKALNTKSKYVKTSGVEIQTHLRRNKKL